MLTVFVEHLLPVFLTAGTGWFLAARLGVHPEPISKLAFWILAPSLIFKLLVANGISGDEVLRMAGFTASVLLLLCLAAAGLGMALRWPKPRIAGLCLVVLLPNAGNFGLPVTRFAFGEPGLAQAGVFFVTASVLTYTVGVFVASLGRRGPREALLGLARVPTLYAVAVGFVLVMTGRTLPGPLDRTVNLLADACIPVFLIVLGMQLRNASWRGAWGGLTAAWVLRLGGGAVLGLLLAPLFGLQGAARQAGIAETAMPSAVITIILATEYDADPAFVTAAVATSTVLSPLTLTPLLAYLGA